MLDAEYGHEDQDHDADDHLEEVKAAGERMSSKGDDQEAIDDDGGGDEDGGDDDEGDDDDGDDGDEGEGAIPSSDGMPAPGGMDEAAAMAIFGDYRQFGSYMMSLSSRLKTMLNNIKTTADPTTRLLTLQELSELLSMSTEDTLAGSFQVEQFVRELVKILGGRGVDEDEDDDGDDAQEQDEDAALAAALAISAGGTYQGDENLEAQVLACRCLANLMEALPGVAHTVVYHGAIPVLCSKLVEISYIDLAEQTLSVSLYNLFLPSTSHSSSRQWKRYQKNSRAPLFGRAVSLRFSTTSISSPSPCNERLSRLLPIVVATSRRSTSL